MNVKEIQKSIRVAQAERDLNNAQLAQRAGVSKAWLYQVLKGDDLNISSAWHKLLAALDLEIRLVKKEDDRS